MNKNHLTRIFSFYIGKLAHTQLPWPCNIWSIWFFAKIMKINLSESERHYSQYQSIGDFFIRKLKREVRPIHSGPLIHPCDSQIVQLGLVNKDVLLQAKGLDYRLSELLGSEQLAKDLSKGAFLTYYLCPTDYHRVHSPVSGEILSCRHIPGFLFPVHLRSLKNRKNLYCQNERVIVEMSSSLGKLVVVFVGATNVGQMSMSFDPQIRTNTRFEALFKKYTPPLKIQKGDELGIFHMGSTVIVVYEKAMDLGLQLLNKKVQMGQSILSAVDK